MNTSTSTALYDIVNVGDLVRSFDFEGRDDCFVDGIVEEITSGPNGQFGCPRYKITVTSVSRGDKGSYAPEKPFTVYPPVNGTPTPSGRVTDRVRVLITAGDREQQAAVANLRRVLEENADECLRMAERISPALYVVGWPQHDLYMRRDVSDKQHGIGGMASAPHAHLMPEAAAKAWATKRIVNGNGERAVVVKASSAAYQGYHKLMRLAASI